MRHLFSLLIISFFSISVSAQSIDEDVVQFVEVEKVPGFEGCEKLSGKESRDCFLQVIQHHVFTNFKYPDGIKEGQVSGMMYVEFVVEKDASISNVEVLKGLPQKSEAARKLESEAVRLVKALEFSSPAIKDEQAVRMKFMLPVKLF